jgi:hypothetical protein
MLARHHVAWHTRTCSPYVRQRRHGKVRRRHSKGGSVLCSTRAESGQTGSAADPPQEAIHPEIETRKADSRKRKYDNQSARITARRWCANKDPDATTDPKVPQATVTPAICRKLTSLYVESDQSVSLRRHCRRSQGNFRVLNVHEAQT